MGRHRVRTSPVVPFQSEVVDECATLHHNPRIVVAAIAVQMAREGRYNRSEFVRDAYAATLDTDLRERIKAAPEAAEGDE